MVGIVILNYSTYADTIKLVDSLQLQTLAEAMHIVVVDNFSPNESYESMLPLIEKYENITVLQTGENLGYARGNNFGVRYIEENINAKYIAILNNDVVLPDNCFERLMERYETLDRPAVIAPIMTDKNGELMDVGMIKKKRFRDDLISLFISLDNFCGRGKTKIQYIDNTGKKCMKVDSVPGSFMFISLENFKKIGYFYPDTFLYGEEAFIAYHVQKEGLNNYILTDATYIHAHRSPTISKYYSTVKKYSMLCDGLILYTMKCRSHPKLKCMILKMLKPVSLLEKYIYDYIKQNR